MIQLMSMDWLTFGFVLADAFFFGVLYALFVRWLSLKQVEGQTAYLVVGGVAFVLILAIDLFGLLVVSTFFALFAAAGLPMVVEYVDRVHRERRRDLEAAQKIAQEAVGDDHQTPDR